VIGILPAAGAGTRIQPLAFSKEVLPVGSQPGGDGHQRPKAVSEFLLERMIIAGTDRVCMVISPEKTDIVGYYARHAEASRLFYVIQERPAGLCDALFRAIPHVHPGEDVLVGLPDTIWFPANCLAVLPSGVLAFVLFWMDDPAQFDAVVLGTDCAVEEIQVKDPRARSHWIWGAFRMPAEVYFELHRLWLAPERGDEYVGTLVNAYLRKGGRAIGVQAGEAYFDVGTIEGYHSAVATLLQPAHLPS
jgi:glucose-1-phosphate thymidylyltransferase